jgi:microcompartment protein CcmL/EutN
MKKVLGFIEYRSIARGLLATDVMLKGGKVDLVQATVMCPGKFVALVSGDISAVKESVEKGINTDPALVISSFVLPNVHPEVIPALSGTSTTEVNGSLGIIETIDASSGVVAGDTAAKAANVHLIEIRLARGMGGKAFVFLCGELSAVEVAVKAACDHLAGEGVVLASSIIASPSPKLVF